MRRLKKLGQAGCPCPVCARIRLGRLLCQYNAGDRSPYQCRACLKKYKNITTFNNHASQQHWSGKGSTPKRLQKLHGVSEQ